MITATDWSETFLGNYMQGQEKLTFFVILLFLTITLCSTLISANEKVQDTLDEQKTVEEINVKTILYPIKFLKTILNALTNSVKTIMTMPFVLRRLTLAECCSWFVNMFLNTKFDFNDIFAFRSAIMTFNLFFTINLETSLL